MPSTGDFKIGQTPIPLQREFINEVHDRGNN